MHTIRRNMDDFHGSDDDKVDAAFLSAAADPTYDGGPIEICLPDRPVAWTRPHVFSLLQANSGIVLKPGEGASLQIQPSEHIPTLDDDTGGMSRVQKRRVQAMVLFLCILWLMWRVMDLSNDGAVTVSDILAMAAALLVGTAVYTLAYRVLWGHWPWR